MPLLITECNFTKKQIFAANNFICKTYRALSAKLHKNHVKFYPLWHLVPVHRCNLAFLLDKCNA